jgi:3-hydroxybutyryl-CoA dehydratase|tara:strand:- start:481 stop:897 length:417 start_codon:yes stop_codon:yes gene_type:complete
MKNFKFKQLKINQSSNLKIKISNIFLKKFIQLSGDNNPIHTNKNFAKKYGFKDKIMHGMLLGTFYSKFIGKKLPGKFSLIMESNIKFHKPVYLNDTISIKGSIKALSSVYKIATIKILATNQFNKKISSAKIQVKLNE